MSVDYHFSAVYGIAGEFDNYDELPEKLAALEDEIYEEPEITPGVKLFLGGNQMCGPRTWSLVILNTQVRCDGRGDNYPSGALPGITKLKSPTTIEKQNLGLAQHTLGLDGEAGWLFLVNVS